MHRGHEVSRRLESLFGDRPPIIGVIHLRPLPGSPDYSGGMSAVLDAALQDAKALERGGAGAVILENFGDAPFFPQRVPPETVAAMSVAAAAVRRDVSLPLGINVLRNDALAALGIASAVGARFIRVNVLAGAAVTDQGLVEGQAHDLMRRRRSLHADLLVFADVHVKHAAPLAPISIEDMAEELAKRAGADAVICTGRMTGGATDLDEVARVRERIPDTPLLVGSGVTDKTVRAALQRADAAIVGTWTKLNGDVREPVDSARVRALVEAL